MSDSYTMDDYVKENILDKYNLRDTKYGYQMGIFPNEYGSLLCRKDENLWYVATDASVMFYDNKPCGIIYSGTTLFNSLIAFSLLLTVSIMLVTRAIELNKVVPE